MGPQGHEHVLGHTTVVHGLATAVGLPPPPAAVHPAVARPDGRGSGWQAPLIPGPATPPKPPPAQPAPNPWGNYYSWQAAPSWWS
eukprot:1784348-Heterocapsa_arctica.AAC.1